MDHDGTKTGFAKDITGAVSRAVNVPVIASGGGGLSEHFADILDGHADAALAASIFHFGEVSIPELKSSLRQKGIPVR
jgi:cyclase